MSGDSDLLERATRALRETTSPTDQELAEGKAVLLWAQRAAQKKSKRSRTLRWVLPLAAVLTAGSALAATEQLQRVARAVVELVAPARDDASRERRRRAPADSKDQARVADAAPLPLAAVPSTLPEPVPPVEPPPAVASPDASASPRKEGARRAPPPLPPTFEEASSSVAPEPEPAPEPESESVRRKGEPPSSADLARYREAHTAHFKERDFAAALAAWDVYLHEFPAGTFVIEARYNRAICLLRLGRTDQARYALRPFARGEIGHGYRQAEATKLLEALE